ncbi:unnamed protein product [Rhizophagus irregularis]|nr:unnamed protein product [Rhizophagus irregularis]CAB4414714.1 unnamed protein product [Rhizophagus irregularis]
MEIHVIHILMVLSDAYPNFTMAEIGQDLRRISHWISIADIIGFLLLILPISTLLPLAWITGHYVDINDLDKANSTRRIHNLVWVIWVKIFLISLIYNWYKLFIIMESLKRKEIVSGTSDMQWTVSTLRRAAIYVSDFKY